MADAGYLTIGKVVKKLQARYPDLSVSKVRFLEDEGLLEPSRTPGGYRLYSSKDIERLETILYLQKERFWPLNVIREQLESGNVRTSDVVGGDADGAQPDAPQANPKPVAAATPAPSGAQPSATPKASAQSQPAQPQPAPQQPEPVAVQPTVVVGDVLAELARDDSPEDIAKLHPIDRMPDLTGAPVGFVQQLASIGLVELKRSPHGRDLVEGKDLALIRAALRLRRYGLEPRHLRQFVLTANRESSMYEQALMIDARKPVRDEEQRANDLNEAFDTISSYTNAIRIALIRRQVASTIRGIRT